MNPDQLDEYRNIMKTGNMILEFLKEKNLEPVDSANALLASYSQVIFDIKADPHYLREVFEVLAANHERRIRDWLRSYEPSESSSSSSM